MIYGPRQFWTGERAGASPMRVLRHRFAHRSGWRPHRHDFSEVFWCEAGTGWHRIAGEQFELRPGDVWFVRPDDLHAGIAGASGMVIVNVSFRTEAARWLARRHRDWPWRPGGAPQHLHLPPRRMERLHAWSVELAEPGTDLADLDAFLADLLRLRRRGGAPPGASSLPPWLAAALDRFADPLHLAAGTPALARLCERSPEHLNRTVRACQGRRATDLVNELRLRWAAARLRLSGEPVADIAAACGLPHLTHFHRLFRAAFGTTPGRYRRDAGQLRSVT